MMVCKLFVRIMCMAWIKELSERMFQKEPLQRCVLHQCHGVCCTYGVWIDLKEKQEILDNFGIVDGCMDPGSGGFDDWFEEEQETDPFTESGKVVHSKLVSRKFPYQRKTCIFLRSDHKCALQVASAKMGKHPWFLKPFYCILHPMDINQEGEITLDDTGIILEEPKSCLRRSQEWKAPIEIFEEELRYLLGDLKYQTYMDLAKEQWTLKANKEVK